MKVLCAQLDIVWQDSAENLRRLQARLQQTASGSCDVLVLPELFHCGFSMEAEQVAQARQGNVYQALSTLARQQQVYVVAGMALRGDVGEIYNAALVFDRQGNELACYAKNRLFSLAGEGRSYQAGREAVVFEVDGTPCSVFICYDLRFPELFRQVIPRAELIFVLANWPDSRQRHWEVLLQARAIENQCFVVGVNRSGTDGNALHYVGGSMVVDPLGQVLCQLPDAPCLETVEIDLRQVDRVRSQFPFLADK
jgi:predicted amidohydrolase